MEHDHAVSILESLHKDSKVFQGILAASDCYPIKDRKTALAKFLYGMGDALLDSPRQTDLFSDASKPADPVGSLVECPECHEKQTDGGPGSSCRNCGVGPLPTNMPLTAKACHQAVNAILNEDEQIDFEEIETWRAAELESAMTWAKEMSLLEGDDEGPCMPLHVRANVDDELTDEDAIEALALMDIIVSVESIQSWAPWKFRSAVGWALQSKRNPVDAETAPSFVQEAMQATGEAKKDTTADRPPFVHENGTMTVDAESRLREVKFNFTVDHCHRALAHDDETGYLQKTVRKAIEAKQRSFEKYEKAPSITTTN